MTARSSASGRALTSWSTGPAGSGASSTPSGRRRGSRCRPSRTTSRPAAPAAASTCPPRPTPRWASGCYLPHLRRAVKASLVACERLLGPEHGAPAVEWREEDLNGDGRVEVSVRTSELAITLNPERGGSLTELAYLARDLDVADVLTRRQEGYHARVRDPGVPAAGNEVRTIHVEATAREAGLAALLEYDRFRRASLLDGLFADGVAVSPLSPWEGARAVVGERPMTRALHVSA